MASSTDSTKDDAWFRTETRKGAFCLVAGGDWVTHQAAKLDPGLRHLDPAGARTAQIDGSEIARLDSAGAWLLLRAKRQLEQAGATVSAFTLPKVYEPLLHTLDNLHSAPPVTLPDRHSFNALLERI